MITNIFYLIGFIACYISVKKYLFSHNGWSNADMVGALLYSISSWLGLIFVAAMYYNQKSPFTDWFDKPSKW